MIDYINFRPYPMVRGLISIEDNDINQVALSLYPLNDNRVTVNTFKGIIRKRYARPIDGDKSFFHVPEHLYPRFGVSKISSSPKNSYVSYKTQVGVGVNAVITHRFSTHISASYNYKMLGLSKEDTESLYSLIKSTASMKKTIKDKILKDVVEVFPDIEQNDAVLILLPNLYKIHKCVLRFKYTRPWSADDIHVRSVYQTSNIVRNLISKSIKYFL